MTEMQMLRIILRLLIAMAAWQFDAGQEGDIRTRKTWFDMRNTIAEARKELERS